MTGQKFDNDKERYDLIPSESINSIAQVFTYGAKKYADRNWEKGINWGRLFAATMRHLWKFWRGQDIDEESGLHHLSHAATNCMMLYWYTINKKEFDDRGKK